MTSEVLNSHEDYIREQYHEIYDSSKTYSTRPNGNVNMDTNEIYKIVDRAIKKYEIRQNSAKK